MKKLIASIAGVLMLGVSLTACTTAEPAPETNNHHPVYKTIFHPAPTVTFDLETQTLTVTDRFGTAPIPAIPASGGWPATAAGTVAHEHVRTAWCRSKAINLGFDVDGRPAFAGLDCDDPEKASVAALISVSEDHLRWLNDRAGELRYTYVDEAPKGGE
ncbi:hypothetical protein [Paeniglutamicibacter sp.]|uniref:hypothetical protein n=1 Tax=Paeniglutamicibacter sp. TaxID=1934391 RepID=UPI003988E3A3